MWARQALGARRIELGGDESGDEGHGEAARPVPWTPPIDHIGGERGLLVVPAAREHALRHVALHRWRRAKAQHQGQFIHASTRKRFWERTDKIGPHLIRVHYVKGHTLALWQMQQAIVLADEQAKKGSALHPCVKKLEQNHLVRTKFLCWLAKFVDRLHAALRSRGRGDVAPRKHTLRPVLPGKLVVVR